MTNQTPEDLRELLDPLVHKFRVLEQEETEIADRLNELRKSQRNLSHRLHTIVAEAESHKHWSPEDFQVLFGGIERDLAKAIRHNSV